MYIASYDRNPLLGRKWMNQLEIFGNVKISLKEIENVNMFKISSQDSLARLFQRYPSVISEEFSSIKKVKAQLKLKEYVKPVFLKSRSVPLNYEKKWKLN